MAPRPTPTPLEAHDRDRARVLKAKIRDRVADVRRHLIALRVAMAEFGEDFDLPAFQAAYDSQDPIELQELADVRARRDPTNAPSRSRRARPDRSDRPRARAQVAETA